MLNHRASAAIRFISAALFALLILPAQGWSEVLSKGVEMTVVDEYPSNLPGIQKVQLSELVIQPGAVLENMPITSTDLCRTTQGRLAVADLAAGTTTQISAGDRFAFEKGSTLTISNPGSVPTMTLIYRFIADESAGAARGQAWPGGALRARAWLEERSGPMEINLQRSLNEQRRRNKGGGT